MTPQRFFVTAIIRIDLSPLQEVDGRRSKDISSVSSPREREPARMGHSQKLFRDVPQAIHIFNYNLKRDQNTQNQTYPRM